MFYSEFKYVLQSKERLFIGESLLQCSAVQSTVQYGTAQITAKYCHRKIIQGQGVETVSDLRLIE